MTGKCWPETARQRAEGRRFPVLENAARASRRSIGRQLSLLGGCALALATGLCLSRPIRADETWIGGSGNWTDGTNWDGGAAPSGSDNVTIDTGGTTTVDSAGQAAGFMSMGTNSSTSLTIDGTGASTGSLTSTSSVLYGAGTLSVTGPNASFNVQGDLVFGRTSLAGATTNVTVSDGAHVSSNRTFLGEEPSPFDLGGSISATVTGPGTVWDAGPGGLLVGGVTGSPATILTIEDGAEMTSTGGADIGYGADADVSVTGADSKLSFDFDLHLGTTRAVGTNALGGDGNGTLTIDDGGEVDAASVVFGFNGTGASGTLNLNGTPGAQGLLQTELLIKDLGTGTANFDGGILRVSGDAGFGGIFIAGFDPGDLSIDAGGLFLDSNGFNIIAESGFSGVGALIKQGAGTLFLTSDNTYTGGTTVEDGTLSIGDGGTTGSVVGDIQIDAPGTLAFNRSDDIAYAGVLSGPGAMVKQGNGTLILDGISTTFTGATSVAAGTLVVGDSSTPTAAIGGTATVDSGATLAGFGTVGNLVNNGRVMGGDPPSNLVAGSLGVLSASGNYAQGTGGALVTYVTQPTTSQVQVSGTASLSGAAVFNYQPGAYVPAIYPILTSGGGVSGAFDAFAESGAIPLNLVRSLSYTSGTVNLVLSLPTQADTGGDDSIFIDTSGTAQRNTQLATSFLLDDVTAKCQVTDKTCFWINPLGHFANFDGHGDANSFTSDTGGFMAGAHRLVADNLTLGVGAGYEYSAISTGSSDGNVDTARVFAYGNLDLAPVVLSGTIGYAHDWFNTDRANAEGLIGVESANESHQASEYSAGLQIALPVSVGAVKLRPKAGLQYAYIDESSFDESDAPPLNLHGDAYSHSSLRSFVGLAVSRQFAIGDVTLTPGLDLGYARELLSAAQGARLSIDGLPSFRPDNPVTARNIVTAGAGIDLLAYHGIDISANYTAGIFVGDGVDHTVRLQGRWTF